jgi:hypothetical protein
MIDMVEVPMEDVQIAELFMRCGSCGLLGFDPDLRK